MKAQKISYHRIFLLAGGISLLIYYLFQWMQMISNPGFRTSLDFVAYYSVGRIAQEDGMAHVYDIDFQHDMEEQVVGYTLGKEQVLLYLHMPYLLPLLYSVVDENYVASFVRWGLLMVAIYALGFYIFTKWFPVDKLLSFRTQFMIGALTFFPCFVSLLLGQNTAILFCGMALLGWGLLKDKEWLAGFGMALITERPQLLVLIALPIFILNRRVFWKFVFFSTLLALFSFFLLGIEGTKSFITTMLLGAGGDWYGLNVKTMINVNGFLLRNFNFLSNEVIRTIGWAVYIASIPVLAVLAMRAKKFSILFFGQMILICMIVVPHLQYHDLTLLLFPLLSVYLSEQTDVFFSKLKLFLHPMIVSFSFMFGILQRTFFPTLVVFILLVFMFRKQLVIQL